MEYISHLNQVPTSPKATKDRFSPIRNVESRFYSPQNDLKFSNRDLKDFEKCYSPIRLSPLKHSQYSNPFSQRTHPRPYHLIDIYSMSTNFYNHPLDWSSNDIIGFLNEDSLLLLTPKDNSILSSYEILNSNSLNFITNSHILAIGSNYGELHFFNYIENKEILTYQLDETPIYSIHSNGNCIICGHESGKISLIDQRSQNQITINSHSDACCTVLFNSLFPNLFASGGNDNSTNIWDLRNLQNPIISYKRHNSAVRAISWSPVIYNEIVTGGGVSDMEIHLWDINNGSLIKRKNAGSQICNLFWNRNYNQILSTEGYEQNSMSLWDASNLHLLARIHHHNERIVYSACSHDNRNIVTITSNDPMEFWNVFPNQNKKVAIR